MAHTLMPRVASDCIAYASDSFYLKLHLTEAQRILRQDAKGPSGILRKLPTQFVPRDFSSRRAWDLSCVLKTSQTEG
jgi:hypothetical protein